MRCQFQLNRSGEGMKGGGQGQCQLPDGRTINVEFPPS
jgi:putative hemolysin